MNRAAVRAAGLLAQARQTGLPVPWRDVLPAGRDEAFAVQEATLAQLGPAGGWKVGAGEPQPGCAPLPAAGILASGCQLGRGFALRGIEVEVAVRLARDVTDLDARHAAGVVRAACDCALPAIEVVETRLADWRASELLAQLADLQSHGALVVGAPAPVPPADFDLAGVLAYLAFDGQPVASCRGANGAGLLWPLVGWLALHAIARGQPLRAGQVVTTGSCSGMLLAPEDTQVVGELQGIGRVQLRT